MRKIRRLLHLLVPAIGMALVLGAVIFGESLLVQLFLVVAGLLMTEAGIWRLAEPILPNERKYTALRDETDHFMALVRQLNQATVAMDRGNDPGAAFALDEMRTELHRSVDRMVTFAGKAATEGPDPGVSGRPGGGQNDERAD